LFFFTSNFLYKYTNPRSAERSFEAKRPDVGLAGPKAGVPFVGSARFSVVYLNKYPNTVLEEGAK
jgi:hypothetical protein